MEVSTQPTLNKIGKSADRVMLIEDNPGDVALVEILLSDTEFGNCEIIPADTLETGLQAIAADPNILAILLDLKLPDSMGLPTLEKVVSAAPNSNIIVMTGTSDRELGLTAVRLGAQDYLVKGAFDADVLSKSLRFSIERNKVLNRLEETQRLAKIGSWDYRSGQEALNASGEFFEILSLPVKQALTLSELKDERKELFDLLDHLHQKAIDLGQFTTETDLILPDGAALRLFIRCNAGVTDDEGAVQVQGILQDVTEHYETQKQVLQSRKRYEEIFAQSNDAIFICSFEGRLVDCNPATEALTGRSKIVLQECTDFHQFIHPEETRVEFLRKLESSRTIKNLDLRIVRPDGSVRECVATANAISIETGEGYTCSLWDVTEHRQVEKLQKERELAEQSSRMKELFLASVSHEMRTPMNAILGMSNILLNMPMPEEQNNLVSSIQHSSQILLGIVNDILQISSLQNGQPGLQKAAFDLEEVLAGINSVMQYKAEEKDLLFSLECPPGLPRYLIGDKLRLNQVLFNLVGNAIKFTDKGQVRLSLMIEADSATHTRLRFEVADTGIGIPQDKLELIFEKFTRIRSKDKIYEGTGLGLAICKSLVEAQGGQIGVTSRPGEGSTFFFELDFEKTDATAVQNRQAPPCNAELLPDDAGFRLLLVEDHKLNQIVAKKTLLRKWPNVHIALAEDGQQAIDLLVQQDFDIVLMDVQMPVMDGFEATMYIRTNLPPGKKEVPILAMTAHAHISLDDKFTQAGMNDFIVKPFDPQELFAKISKHIRNN